MTTYPALPIPSPLRSDYTAPAGTYSPVQVNTFGQVNADLSKATIIGAGTGYLFKPQNGAALTVQLGDVVNMAGVCLGLVGAGGRASVVLEGGILDNVISGVLYKSKDGGRLDAIIRGAFGHGMGAGIRTYGSAELDECQLYGGGNPSSGEPAALHALDLNDLGIPVADQYVRIINSILRGFETDDGQGDIAVIEETVWDALIADNELGDVTDALVDSKGRLVVVTRNKLNGRVGVRMVDSHSGRLYSIANEYTVPDGAYALQATAGSGGPDPQHPTIPGLISDGDVFDLTPGGLIARAQVACQGSTGFTLPRCGVIQLRGARWNTEDTAPWVEIDGICSTDGQHYYPQVVGDAA